jgi:hypothetical protein
VFEVAVASEIDKIERVCGLNPNFGVRISNFVDFEVKISDFVNFEVKILDHEFKILKIQIFRLELQIF